MSGELIKRMQQAQPVVKPVKECQYSSKEDYDRIMHKIGLIAGGHRAFDDFVECIVDLSFGICKRLGTASEAAKQKLELLQSVEMNCTWDRSIEDLEQELGMGSELSRLRSLQDLTARFQGNARLGSVAPLGAGLAFLTGLRVLRVDLGDCAALRSLDEVARGVGGRSSGTGS